MGNVELINKLNSNTSKKVIKSDIIRYIENHDKKFDNGLTYLNNQLKEDIQKQFLEFFNKPKQILIQGDQKRIITGSTTYKIEDIYNDMINDQKISNQYLTEKIGEYLKYEFENTLIPEIRKFIEKHS